MAVHPMSQMRSQLGASRNARWRRRLGSFLAWLGPEGRGISALLLLAIVATLPGWMPGCVFVPEASVRGGGSTADRLAGQEVRWTIFAADCLRHGILPTWDPHTQLGEPLLGNGQSGVLYPTIVLQMFLPAGWSWTISAMLRLWTAGVGAWFLARRCGLGEGGRLMAGVAFMLCGFNLGWLLINDSPMNVVPLLPWAIIAAERLAERASAWRILGMSLVLAAGGLGGRLEAIFALLFSVALIWVLRVAFGTGLTCPQQNGRRGLLRALPALGVATFMAWLLSGVQWVTFAGYLDTWGSNAFAIGRESAASGRVRPGCLLGLMSPYLEKSWGGAWIGTVPLIFAVLAMVTGWAERRVRLWASVVAVAMILAVVQPAWNGWAQRWPGLGVSGAPTALATAALGLAMLAGIGLEQTLLRFRQVMPVLWMHKDAILAGGGLLALVLAGFAAWGMVRTGVADVRSVFALVPAAMLFVAMLLLHWTMLNPRGSPGLAAWPWVALGAIDLLAFGVTVNTGVAASDYMPSEAIRFMQQNQARFVATDDAMASPTATALGPMNMREAAAMVPTRIQEGLASIVGSSESSDAAADAQRYGRPALRLLALRYLLADGDVPLSAGSPWKRTWPSTQPGEGYGPVIYERTDALPRAWIAERQQAYSRAADVLARVKKMDFNPMQVVLIDREVDPPFVNAGSGLLRAGGVMTGRPVVNWLEDLPGRVRLSIGGGSGGYLVLADAYAPGWIAQINYWDAARERNIERDAIVWPAFGVLRAVPIPASGPGQAQDVEVVLEYAPKAIRHGQMATLLGGILAAILLGWGMLAGESDTIPPRTTDVQTSAGQGSKGET